MVKLRFKFTVPGEPRGKGRPQFSRPSGRAYTPKGTVLYESDIKAMFYAKYPDVQPLKGAVGVRIWAYYKIPEKASKADREAMIAGKKKPLKKPDLDNIEKAVLDALNKVAYIDDSHVTKKTADKYYGLVPRVEIEIYEDD